MTKIKEGDWVELDFVGRIERTNQIFDLTIEDIAKKEGIYQNNQEYKPLKVRIGSNYLLKGLDKFLVGKETNNEYSVNIKPEEAFGKRNPKLIQLTSLAKLKRKGVNPVPGMPLNIDGMIANVRSTSGGRVILDFNHPLSGKELNYKLWVRRKIEKIEEKVKALCSFLNLEENDYKIKLENKELQIRIKKEIPNIEKIIEKRVKEQIPEIKETKVILKNSKKEQKDKK